MAAVYSYFFGVTFSRRANTVCGLGYDESAEGKKMLTGTVEVALPRGGNGPA